MSIRFRGPAVALLVLLAHQSPTAQVQRRPQAPSPSSLAPPVVVSPINECARSVRVEQFVPGATTRVFADGTEVGRGQSSRTTVDVALIRPLTLGESITATQLWATEESFPSTQVVVTAFPATLNAPVVGPNLYACGRVVPVDQL